MALAPDYYDLLEYCFWNLDMLVVKFYNLSLHETIDEMQNSRVLYAIMSMELLSHSIQMGQIRFVIYDMYEFQTSNANMHLKNVRWV